MPPLLPEIDSYYELGAERSRLDAAQGELERLRTQDVLRRHLPAPPAVIYDIGGAAGVYAFPLAEQGYSVHLVDPVPLHIQQAQDRSAASGIILASLATGDARQLDFPSAIADVVLLLGPLYHLTNRADRLRALHEARRILKPDGLLFAAAISRFASLIDGLTHGAFHDPQFRSIVSADLASGQHRNSTSNPAYFTTAYFHRPEDLAAEVQDAGFTRARVLAVEGPAWSARHFHDVWSDAALRSALMDFLSSVEEDPSLLGASAHLLTIARA